MNDLHKHKSKKFQELRDEVFNIVAEAFPEQNYGYIGFALLLSGLSLALEYLQNDCNSHKNAKELKEALKECLLDYVVQVDAVRVDTKPKTANNAQVLKMGDR